MSIARHHAEWLSLVEASGPFLSLPVLLRVFSTGLDGHDVEHRQRLRSAYEEWLDNQHGVKPEVGIHRAWVEFVLRETLELPEVVMRSGQALPPGLSVRSEQHGETLRPDWAVVEPDAPHVPRLLVQMVGVGQGLEKAMKGSWAVSPATKMMELLHATGVRLGLVTNGEQWMLVNAPKGESTGFISWYGGLWLEEPLTLRAFRSLLGVRRFFGVDEGETLEGMLAASAVDQQDVTDQLGYQVRRAVEVLVQAIARIDRPGLKLEEVLPSKVYESALTVMMRLVFLFCAEERDLIPSVGGEFYGANYAVATLRESLRGYADQHGEEVLERRSDAWCRLLATFRAVYAGVNHDALQIPAYGGSLFDPDRFPWLEGRGIGSSWRSEASDPIAVNNRVVLHLLEALQLLQIQVPGAGMETRRMSFRALDIEQIGHVYEGLLDHTAVRSSSPVLGLKGKKFAEPEVELATLEAWMQKPIKDCLKWLKEISGRSESAIKKDLEIKPDGKSLPGLFLQRLMTRCDNDRELYERVLPFVGLLREDTLKYPVVIGSGMVYVTEGTDRRSTGTHYTPRSLTEEIVKYTLEPLVYVGPAEGAGREDWRLRSASEILRLRVCDVAMGSGAFLVQVCRYLAERVVEAWGEEGKGKKEEGREEKGELRVLPDGSLAIGEVGEVLLPIDPEEQLLVARRLVADRCLYGVDKNPLAVEMAKLSLWLITLQKDRPFTFVDHALKCGDSLLGLTRAEQIEFLHLKPDNKAVQLEMVSGIWRPILDRAIEMRRELASFSVNAIGDLREKERLYGVAEGLIDRLRFVGDYLVARALADSGKTAELTAEELMVVSDRIQRDLQRDETEEESRDIKALKSQTNRMMNLGNPVGQAPRTPFHWLLEFPEVFLEGDGFSAIVGNPPFQGGSKITGTVGTDYRTYLVDHIAKRVKGNADLCAYFFLNALHLLNSDGRFGLVATNTIAQGDTREVGLDQLVAQGHTISRAVPSRPWIGSANLEVGYIWLQKGEWNGESVLDEKVVNGITEFLTSRSRVIGKPHSLFANFGKSFTGNKVYGEGFVITLEEAQVLIEKETRNGDVIFPYLNGDDLNSRFDQSPSRWVINFGEMSLEEAYNYPDCLEILEKLVKPYRETVKRAHTREKWWLHEHTRKELYRAIGGQDRILVHPLTSKYNNLSFYRPGIIFSHMTIILSIQTWWEYSLIQSELHWHWVLMYGNKLATRPQYTPTDCFETFPFPQKTDVLESIGEAYYTHRQTIMQTRNEGLTKTYNRFHNPNETAEDITKLRELHIEMDNAVATAYGWQDLSLDHNFHPTKQGIRFTLSETARREVLDRLLQLNHDRYAEEVAQGLHDKKKKGKAKKEEKKSAIEPAEIQGNLF